jgi:hypothetical protein
MKGPNILLNIAMADEAVTCHITFKLCRSRIDINKRHVACHIIGNIITMSN